MATVTGRCLGADPGCNPFQLTNDTGANQYINGLVNESLNIGGAIVNIYKLLGIYEQNKLVDLVGGGTAIFSSEYTQFPAANVFVNDNREWRSGQKGDLVVASAYIGYDFGAILLDNKRVRYSTETEVKYHITSIRIQQCCDSRNRVTKVRVERSDDNELWYGVAIVNLPDDSSENWIDVKQSAPSRYWRLRPLAFNGSSDDFWVVRKLSLSEFTKTDITNVQDELGFMENRDRSYSIDPIMVKGYYDVQDIQTDLTRFGYDFKNQYFFKIGFDSIIRRLGRPIVVGDVLEIPSEIQYDINLNPIKKYLEVTDVGWASAGYTPGYQPTIYSVVAEPLIASQETQDIIGDINAASSDNGFFDMLQNHYSPEHIKADQKIRAASDTEVSEAGFDTADEYTFSEEAIKTAADAGVNIKKLNPPVKGAYVESGLPPNGLPFTEGVAFPANPSNGDYHRLTYINLPEPIPPRLYKFYTAKNRWVFMEEDQRMRLNSVKPQYDEFLNSSTRIAPDQIR